MDVRLKLLCEELQLKNQKDLIKYKQAEKQIRVVAHKPQTLNLTSDECKKLCDKAGIHYAPGYEQRVLQYIVTDETVDRYGDIVRASGAQLDNYLKNPMMFYNHNYHTPIGNAVQTNVDRKLKQVTSWGLFMDDSIDKTGLSDVIFRMSSSGFLKACSIGFMPLEAIFPKSQEEADKLGIDRWGAVFTKWDLMEWSPCGVPANPSALQNSLQEAKGLQLRKEDIGILDEFDVFTNKNVFDEFVERAFKKSTKTISLPQFGLDLGLKKLDSSLLPAPIDEGEEGEKILTTEELKSIQNLGKDIVPVTDSVDNAVAAIIKAPKEYVKTLDDKKGLLESGFLVPKDVQIEIETAIAKGESFLSAGVDTGDGKDETVISISIANETNAEEYIKAIEDLSKKFGIDCKTTNLDTGESSSSDNGKEITGTLEETTDMVSIPKSLYDIFLAKSFTNSILENEMLDLKESVKSLQEEQSEIIKKIDSPKAPKSKSLYDGNTPNYFRPTKLT